MKRVLITGTFDHLHPGHLFLLNEAQSRACPPKPSGRRRGELFVIVARDRNVVRIKGHAPSQSEEVRRRAIEEAFPDAHVVLGDVEDFLRPVRDIRPDLIILGYDQNLPPGIAEADLPCRTERIAAFEPEKYKSSLQNNHGGARRHFD